VRTPKSLRIGRRLPTRDVVALLAACDADPSPGGARDAAIIALLIGAGLTVAAVRRISASDYDNTDRCVTLPRNPRGAIMRSIVLDEAASHRIDRWLALRGRNGGTIFFATSADGSVREEAPLGARSVSQLLRRRSFEAVLAPRPSDLRFAFFAALRDQQRQNPFAAAARFGLTEDGEARLILPGLTLPSPAEPTSFF
jgi:integrase/recombinase XerD